MHQWDVWVPHRDVFSPQRISETVTRPFLGISDSASGERVTEGQAGLSLCRLQVTCVTSLGLGVLMDTRG